MKARDVNKQRGRIARLRDAGMGARRIAAEVGCAKSTVYRALAAGGADRRTDGGKRFAAEARPTALRLSVGRSTSYVAAEMARMVAAGKLQGPAPSKATVARWIKDAWQRGTPLRTEPEGEVEWVDPYGDLELDADGVVATADEEVVRGEVRLARGLLRDAIKELKQFAPGTPERFRARAQAGALLDVLMRVRRWQKGGGGLSPELQRLAEVEDEARALVLPAGNGRSNGVALVVVDSREGKGEAEREADPSLRSG